jgi:response regulator of citrate/malate metabolism
VKILIVEDDPMVGQINQRFALKLAFVEDAEIAVSIEAARELLQKKTYDLLLLDVYFPGGRGPDLLQWIRSKKLPLNVIFITADNSQATVERALHLGALDYLVKPFTFDRFKAALEDAQNRIEGIYNEKKFDQQTLDQVFHKKGEIHEDRVEGLDKGMSYKTYEMVRNEVFRTKGFFTAEQMGEKLGMARVTIRRYLDFLEKQSLLEVELQYGKIGRPQHNYRVKGKK